MYNLLEYSKNYSSLWQYFRDEPNDPIRGSELFKFVNKFAGSKSDNSITKYGEIIVTLKYLSNLWLPLGLPEADLLLTWSKNCLKITDTATRAAQADNPTANAPKKQVF